MLIEVKDGDKIISSREVKIRELNLLERGKFLDLMLDFQTNPSENYFTRLIEVCRICTDYPDDELNKFSNAELMQLFNAIIKEKNKPEKKS